jgi:hypothetical protein
MDRHDRGENEMYARVAKFEGGDPDQVREQIAEIDKRSASGPPEGVPGKEMMVLYKDGAVLVVGLFETEADLKQGDATLNAMDPPTPGAMGERTSVEHYEVLVKVPH